MMRPTLRPPSMAVAAIPKHHSRTNVRCRPQPRTKLQSRGFTSSAAARATMAQTRMPKNAMSKMPKQQAMKSMMKNLPVGELPNDFGFLPQTIVYGPSNYPSFFSDFKTRYKIEYWRIRQSIWGMGLCVASIRRVKLPLTVSQACVYVQMAGSQTSRDKPENEETHSAP
jgi:hypothetical protein